MYTVHREWYSGQSDPPPKCHVQSKIVRLGSRLQRHGSRCLSVGLRTVVNAGTTRGVIMNHEDRSAETHHTAPSRSRVPARRAGAVGVLSLIALTWTFAGTVRTQDQAPNPPYDPTKVTIANEPPFFLNDKSIANPYSDPNYNPKTAGGRLSPLMFTHVTAVHGGLVWKKNAEMAEAAPVLQTFGIQGQRRRRSRRPRSVDQLEPGRLGQFVAARCDVASQVHEHGCLRHPSDGVWSAQRSSQQLPGRGAAIVCLGDVRRLQHRRPWPKCRQTNPV